MATLELHATKRHIEGKKSAGITPSGRHPGAYLWTGVDS